MKVNLHKVHKLHQKYILKNGVIKAEKELINGSCIYSDASRRFRSFAAERM